MKSPPSSRLAVFRHPVGRVRAQEAPATVVPVSVNGDPAARFSLVVMSDGYTAAEMPKYRAHLDKHLNVLWSIEPFRSYRNYINVYSVEIVSPESGVSCDPEVRVQRKTPLGANFTDGCTNPNARGILVNQNIAREYAKRATPAFDQILVITNTDTYGGIGGGVATTSGGNSLGVLITPHELGHSLGRLQDEYTYRERGVPGGPYKGAEPTSVHHTLMTEEQMRTEKKKWFRWLGDESESGGKIGRFEGGQYTTTGVWRPSKHSMMISIGYYFDQVSRERMVQRISEQVNLIARARPTDTPLGINELVCIEPAQPNYHSLDITWQLNGKEMSERRGAHLHRHGRHRYPERRPHAHRHRCRSHTVRARSGYPRWRADSHPHVEIRQQRSGRGGAKQRDHDHRRHLHGTTSRRNRSGLRRVHRHPSTAERGLVTRRNDREDTPGSRRISLADQKLRPGTPHLEGVG